MIVCRVLFIRHGETEYNRERRLQGALPVPLNDCGRLQSVQLAQYLKKVPIDAIYASPRARAWQTAQIIGETLAQPVIEDERLAEIAFGDFEGHSFAEVKELFPAAYRKWESGFRAYRVPRGESRLDVQRRMHAAWEDIIRSGDEDTVAIVGHSSAIKILLASMFAILPEKPLSNTSITTLQRNDDIWEIAGYGETPHLETSAGAAST